MSLFQELRQEIEAKLNLVQKIHFEPRLLSPDDDRLMQREQSGKRSKQTHITRTTPEAIQINSFHARALSSLCVCVHMFQVPVTICIE